MQLLEGISTLAEPHDPVTIAGLRKWYIKRHNIEHWNKSKKGFYKHLDELVEKKYVICFSKTKGNNKYRVNDL
jgi:hypothetical protein